jgi:hypothetical protein
MTTLIPKFDIGGTGASNRAINLKLAEIVSVKDFGAIGDGTTDDTAAIQAAINANQNSTIIFPQGTYKVSSTILLTDSSGHNFQGNLIGQNATINFTNAGSSSDTDATMQNGFQAYPVTNGTGGDTTGLRYAIIQGFIFNGPTNGACVRLANSYQVTFQNNQTNSSRYGLVTECCINTKVLNNRFATYTNAGYGMLMTSNSNIWYGSGTPSTSYWNDNPLIESNGFGTSATNNPLAHILDHGSQAESIRLLLNNFFISAPLVGGSFFGTAYAYIGRNCQVTMERNWFENIYVPIRILSTNAAEGTGNLVGVSGAQPSGTYAISNFPDGFSRNGIFKGNYFSKTYQDINASGINGTCEIGSNITQSMAVGGTHILSTQSNTNVVDSGDYVAGLGAYTYINLNQNTYFPLANDWVSYTPTVSSSSGTITSYTINSANYLIVKNRGIEIQLDISITNGGTGSGVVNVTLPTSFPSVTNGGVFAGKEVAVNGKALTGLCTSTTVQVSYYDNTYSGATGLRLVLSGLYKSA